MDPFFFNSCHEYHYTHETCFKILDIVLLEAAFIYLGRLTRDNQALLAEVEQLEAELGRMEITDFSQVYLVEVKNPDVPPNLLDNWTYLSVSLLHTTRLRCQRI